ncbi:uncharacterized protein L969DRAFT_46990 [Mixia osmundae IAM 14324]|uniref:Mediator of RNA polymerase II transcription subunit 4 n=1 Tax=Mixia osmundae (strain CBS 9802 / IAM 14324 / JCM 22182 / KY 12970) TaxID=764103 RepID=G7EAR2_MIXOS|nr:uncharacterized protein L969DRAFT_46990 [Mixia osmundae IAM 14324]KEI40891.1 hypothetical protein L969DRAFT_46990 [Mixia osmundae IAM 14324]GAA99922.1 hypothetical protein E5Q_06625 [Mixia osmundae IAM 14324]
MNVVRGLVAAAAAAALGTRSSGSSTKSTASSETVHESAQCAANRSAASLPSFTESQRDSRSEIQQEKSVVLSPRASVDDEVLSKSDVDLRNNLVERMTRQELSDSLAHATLLPANLAQLISSLSLASRISLRASALLLEALLEGARCTTSTGLGVTRRALIAAVSSARALHFMQEGLSWDGGDNVPSEGFLNVLDKWTNLGIYFVHHSFTLAELFAMSGFYLTATGLKTGFSAAEESVRMIDGIFGSTETSRALASIITLVRREMTQDPRFSPAKAGVLASVAALTKALTAFACLQTATRQRTVESMKMKMLYDCTVVLESASSNILTGSATSVNGAQASSTQADTISKSISSQWPPITPHKRIPSVRGTSPRLEPLSTFKSHHGTTRSHRASTMASADDQILLTDIRSVYEQNRRWEDESAPSEIVSPSTSYSSRRSLERSSTLRRLPQLGSTLSIVDIDAEDDEEIMHGLEELIGSDDDGEGEVLLEVKRALAEVARGKSIPDGLELVSRRHGDDGEEVKLVRSTRFDALFEIETTTMTQTTTTIRSHVPLGSTDGAPSSRSRLPRTGCLPDLNHLSSRNIDMRGTLQARRTSDDAVHTEQDTEDYIREEWTEMQSIVDSPNVSVLRSKASHRLGGSLQPSPSIAMLCRQEAVDDPEESGKKLQIVLKSITNKLHQRKRTFRNSNLTSPESSRPASPVKGSRIKSDKIRELTTNEADDNSPPRQKALAGRIASTSQKAFNAAKTSLNVSPTRKRSSSRRRQKPDTAPRTEGTAPAVATIHSSALEVPAFGKKPFPSEKARGDGGLAAGLRLPASRKADTRQALSEPSTPRLTARSTGSSQSIHTTHSHVETRTSHATDQQPKPTNFPHAHLVANLRRFGRYSSAAYGQHFMRIFGIGSTSFNFPSTASHHANHYAFSNHVEVALDDILLSSFTTGTSFDTSENAPLVHYVTVDHQAKAIVLTCRGTLGLSDILTDLTADYIDVTMPEGEEGAHYFAHKGMYQSASRLANQGSIIHEVLRKGLAEHPTYGLVLCGHSLGGGVAALLSLLWGTPTSRFTAQAAESHLKTGKKIIHPTLGTPFVTAITSGLPAGRPMHCYTYGCPCVASPDLAAYAKGLISSVVHNLDIVPTLSLGLLRDLKNVAASLYEEGKVAEEVVGRVVGLYQRRYKAKREARKNGQTYPTADEFAGSGSGFSPHELDDEARQVDMTPRELQLGRGSNKALEAGYRDPALVGRDLSDDAELNDWLWSLMKTMRAGNDSDKLLPPGDVFCIECHTVFVSNSMEGSDGRSAQKSFQEGTRVLLRECLDPVQRFSEPVFGRSMFLDHSPHNYEHALNALAAASPLVSDYLPTLRLIVARHPDSAESVAKDLRCNDKMTSTLPIREQLLSSLQEAHSLSQLLFAAPAAKQKPARSTDDILTRLAILDQELAEQVWLAQEHADLSNQLEEAVRRRDAIDEQARADLRSARTTLSSLRRSIRSAQASRTTVSQAKTSEHLTTEEILTLARRLAPYTSSAPRSSTTDQSAQAVLSAREAPRGSILPWPTEQMLRQSQLAAAQTQASAEAPDQADMQQGQMIDLKIEREALPPRTALPARQEPTQADEDFTFDLDLNPDMDD